MGATRGEENKTAGVGGPVDCGCCERRFQQTSAGQGRRMGGSAADMVPALGFHRQEATDVGLLDPINPVTPKP